MKESPEVHFTPEQELLLWSIRVDHTKDQRIEEILKAGVDWNYVQETAIQHGIIPLLYKRLKEEMSDFVPPQELEELRTIFMANAVQNLRMTQQLIKVLDLLADAGIEAIPFKGPALAVQAYGDLSMRSFCDLDILIHERDFDRMYSVLCNAGFEPKYLIDNKSKRKLAIINNNFTFLDGEISIDIHWRIVERWLGLPIYTHQLFENSVVIFLDEQKFKTLKPEDVLILTCIHGMKHYWKELRWLADLSHLMTYNQNVQWSEFLNRIEELHAKRIFNLGLLLAIEHGGIRYYPKNVNLQFPNNSIDSLVKEIQTNFFNSPRVSLFFFTPPFYYIKLRERIRDQVNFVIFNFIDNFLTPNSNDFKTFQLPEVLFPAYFLIRHIRIFFEFLPHFFKYYYR